MENFDSIVAEYYDNIIAKGYHDNKRYLAALMTVLKRGERVLELGCGTGLIFLALLEGGIVVEGIDTSTPMVQKLKRKYPQAVVHLSSLDDFSPPHQYDYVLSCNGPFSIKGDELESYILDKKQVVAVLRKYIALAKHGLLINKGTEKPHMSIALSKKEEFVHKELRINDFMIMINLLLRNKALMVNKTFIKRQYKLRSLLKKVTIKELPDFLLLHST